MHLSRLGLLVHLVASSEWALGPLWRVNVADDARSWWLTSHSLAPIFLGVLLFDPGAGPCWVAWWAWQGAHPACWVFSADLRACSISGWSARSYPRVACTSLPPLCERGSSPWIGQIVSALLIPWCHPFGWESLFCAGA